MAPAVDQLLGWALFHSLQDENHSSYSQGAYRLVMEWPDKLRVTCSMISVLTKVGGGPPASQQPRKSLLRRRHMTAS